MRNKREPVGYITADSTSIAAILGYSEPSLDLDTLEIRRLKTSSLVTMASVMLEFNANDDQKYRGVKLIELANRVEDSEDDTCFNHKSPIAEPRHIYQHQLSAC